MERDEKFQEVVEQEDGLPAELKRKRLFKQVGLAVVVLAVAVAAIYFFVRHYTKPVYWHSQGKKDNADLKKVCRWAAAVLCNQAESTPEDGGCGVEVRAIHSPPDADGSHVAIAFPCPVWKKLERRRSAKTQKEIFEGIRRRFGHHYRQYHDFTGIGLRVYVEGYRNMKDLIRRHKKFGDSADPPPRPDDPRSKRNSVRK